MRPANISIQPLTLATYPDPVLKQVAGLVRFPLNEQELAWIERLRFTMLDAQGVGIAAPQAGKSWQLMIVASKANQRYPDAPNLPAFEICNPKIVAYSEQQELGWEGCLSVPGKRAKIARASEIMLRYQNVQGEYLEARYSGFVARIIQHEYDHLQGICIVERVPDAACLISEQDYQQQFMPQ
ncbi:peptide deformylase 2 [Agarivorans sp. Toyoura001]|uniref:peptide deformylase n=1 Tax=Agarivorans sp. Toyoura001 TaxID=2283141 RepID=UPI0010E7D7E8|nr:peptide deformylase [Agarivorans sp. Toyoura001]GDY27071.1 peptide deformylase 2 [Agarivorans sp. Toyoura001]